MISRYGVCYDLKSSPFTCESCNFVFFFSTRAHMERFERERQAEADWLCDSLGRRFKVRVRADRLAVLNLYRKVETRGFYVIDRLASNRAFDTLDQLCVDCVVRDA